MNKHIIKDRQIIEDSWQQLSDDESLPENAKVIISYQRWQEQKLRLISYTGSLGIVINEDIPIEELKEDLDKLSLIAIEFPAFKDGRGYSSARLLRERYGYKGELRAIGNILRDQLYYLYRCGFDAFELESDRDPEDALKAYDEFNIHYQTAVN